LRAPRRTALTVLGIAAAVTALVAVLGLLDTFSAAGRASAAELGHSSPGRLVVTLDRFYPSGAALPRLIARTPGVATAQPQIIISAQLRSATSRVDAAIQVIDLDNDLWTPTLLEDRGPRGGLVLSEKAARDLGVAPGEDVVVRHPVRTDNGFRLATSRVPVRALHPNPWRTYSYLDSDGAALFGLSGAANQVVVVPSGDPDALTRQLFRLPGVTAVEPATSLSDVLDNALDQFTGILRVIEVATLLLAMLIALNSASISAEERTRERATMYAFGLPTGIVMSLSVAENAVIGFLGTVVGIGGGYAALSYITAGFDEVTPELLVEPTLSTTTVLACLGLGVLAVAIAPVFGLRREHRMDIPSALRVVE